ncbi:MAG: hypothetical protein HYT70_01605, partial [Candidatus Aenigmarchaeota archaeon]|nr:hypothetical protein [Candidatus Aenigmarchaeota archaeon]
MKGQISIVEAVTTAIVLIVAFNIIIQKPSFENKWSDAIVSVNGRDVILAADRLGKLYGYSFSEAEFVNFISGIG